MHHSNVEAWCCRSDPLRLLNHPRLSGRLKGITASFTTRLLTGILIADSWDHDKGPPPCASL
jgi:hypothetical protein